MFAACEGEIELDVVSSNLTGNDNQVHNVLNLDESEWLADEENKEHQGFVLRTRGCKRAITGIRIQNAAQPRATKSFRVSGASEFNRQWNNLVEANLEENNAVATFHLSQPEEVRFIRFVVLSSHRGKGGGLQLIRLTTGQVYVVLIQSLCCPECTALQTPVVFSHTIYSGKYPATNVFNNVDGVNWIAPDNYIGDGFTIRISDCRLNIAGIRLKNSCCNRATRAFRISGILEDSGLWSQLLQGELVNVVAPAPKPKLQTFHFKEAVETKFLKFDVDSYWGASAALNYLEVITVKGNLCSP